MPDPASPWDHLHNVLMRVQNELVREEFNDLGDNDDIIDINTPRGSLYRACKILDGDTATMAMLRLYLFNSVIQGGSKATLGSFYSIPILDFQETVKFLPQVRLVFAEDYASVPTGQSPLKAWLSFRIMGETPEGYNETKARTLAQKIATEFGTANGYRFSKGTYLCSYNQQVKGYSTQVYAISEAEGRQVLSKLLSINGDTIDEDCFTVSTRNKPAVNTPGSHRIYGKTVRKYRYRPTGIVRFRYAEMHLHGLPNPVTLVDNTRQRRDALIRV